VGYLRALIAEVSARCAVDAARIHLCGLSNGGRMAYRMALEAPELLASVAVVAGAWSGEGTTPARPVPTLIFHGTADKHIPYGGGVGSRGRAVAHLPAPEAAYRWAQLMGCGGKPQRSFQDGAHCDAMASADGRSDVAFWTIPQGGHAWPGGKAWSPTADKPVEQPSATELIWDFFERHPMN
jgi:polyhydroxybutyrate depolymerase